MIVSLDELKTLIEKHARAEAGPMANIPSLYLGTRSGPTQPSQVVVEPVVSIVAQGGKRIKVGNQVLDYQAGQFLVVSVDLPADAHITDATPERPYLGCALTLRPEAIASLLVESGGQTIGDDQPGIGVSELSKDLVDSVVRLLRLLDQPSDIPILAPAIEREILWRLVNSSQGAMVRQIGLADSRLTQVGQVVRWLRGHFTETIRIEELAEIARMSVTSLHRHFRTVTSLTPIQYQKQLRLQAARARLMATRDEAAEVGYAVGYDSPSQFSREYRRMFGKPPARDVADARANPSQAPAAFRIV